MKQNQVSRRLAQEAREKLSSILLFEVSDPRLSMVTITGCEVSIDRSVCKVYVTSDPERYESVLEGLESAKGRLRSLLGKALGWRVSPELIFEIDYSTDEAERIQKALSDVPPTLNVMKDEEGYPIEMHGEEEIEG